MPEDVTYLESVTGLKPRSVEEYGARMVKALRKSLAVARAEDARQRAERARRWNEENEEQGRAYVFEEGQPVYVVPNTTSAPEDGSDPTRRTRKLEEVATGPWRVIMQKGENTYLLRMCDSGTEAVWNAEQVVPLHKEQVRREMMTGLAQSEDAETDDGLCSSLTPHQTKMITMMKKT